MDYENQAKQNIQKDRSPLTESAIRTVLPSGLAGLQIRVLDSIDSTNNEAKRMILSGASSPFLLVAEEQTAGRGRLGRSFYSPSGTGLYMTVAYRTSMPLSHELPVTAAAAVAVTEAIEALTDRSPVIKWVNDVYLDGKKVCGILTEAVAAPDTNGMQYIIVGIGVNLTTSDFPDELSGRATSLFAVDLPRSLLCAQITASLFRYIAALPDKHFLPAYRRHSAVLGQEITYQSGADIRSARVIAIDDNCGLTVQHADGTEVTLRTGEITVRLKESGQPFLQ